MGGCCKPCPCPYQLPFTFSLDAALRGIVFFQIVAFGLQRFTHRAANVCDLPKLAAFLKLIWCMARVSFRFPFNYQRLVPSVRAPNSTRASEAFDHLLQALPQQHDHLGEGCNAYAAAATAAAAVPRSTKVGGRVFLDITYFSGFFSILTQSPIAKQRFYPQQSHTHFGGVSPFNMGLFRFKGFPQRSRIPRLPSGVSP